MVDGAPPPWLINMQRYGPPPSYPSLKIPGLNAPIPPGAQFGYHPGASMPCVVAAVLARPTHTCLRACLQVPGASHPWTTMATPSTAMCLGWGMRRWTRRSWCVRGRGRLCTELAVWHEADDCHCTVAGGGQGGAVGRT